MTRREWERTFLLLLKPIVTHAADSHARVHLPHGRPSASGPESDSLEAFARSMWMAGPWLATHPTGEALVDGRTIDLGAFYREGFVNGTDPHHPDSWFRLLGLGQTLVEAAAMAWNLWLARERLWDPLSAKERHRVLAWFSEASAIPPVDNNWRLFSALLMSVSKHLGGRFDQAVIDAHLDRVESFYVGDGWYNDGPLPGGRTNWSIDYYNALVLHPYLLYWSLLDGDTQPERRERIVGRASEFQRSFVHWFSSDGSFPCFGRSMVYRMGVSHVFPAAVLADACPLPLGQVRRLCGRVIGRFLDAPGVLGSDGELTMGFRREFQPMMEPYSGPGSPYWAAKAFVVLAIPEDHPFWSSAEEDLPIEDADYTLAIPAAGFLVRGDRATAHVQVVNGKSLVYPKKYSDLAYSSHFGYEIERHQPTGTSASDPFGEAGLTLSRDGRSWYARSEVRLLDIRDGVLITEAVYRLGEPWLARPAKAVSVALSDPGPGRAPAMRNRLRAIARAIYRRVAPMLTPRATVVSAVMFVEDQQVRAHQVRSRVKVRAREGGFACAWDDEREPELSESLVSHVRTRHAASGIRGLIGYDRTLQPRRSDHNVLHLHSSIPRIETARSRRGVLRVASVSLGRPSPFPPEEVGRRIGHEAERLIGLLEEAVALARSRRRVRASHALRVPRRRP